MAEDKEKTAAKEPEAPKAKGPILCGHQNKHFTPATKDGQPVQGDKLTCTLERGHQPVRVVRIGPKGEDLSTYEVVHSAPYKTVKGGAVVDDIAYWSDAAGEKPA